MLKQLETRLSIGIEIGPCGWDWQQMPSSYPSKPGTSRNMGSDWENVSCRATVKLGPSATQGAGLHADGRKMSVAAHLPALSQHL